ncbi:L,D-transpeptidase [Actinomadura sp. NAK00032]|uniref:L,D-transpeptidase n=1 Tax=Actinomadura sp. NAK00032 TaxID=2742128 RepID=UPI0015929FF0|nr:L,D-transpeptidase [Actinomadura sp. NAK00032]QKW39687.1 L,D-transpeptidase [Actinomadura sp. NAK00032]
MATTNAPRYSRHAALLGAAAAVLLLGGCGGAAPHRTASAGERSAGPSAGGAGTAKVPEATTFTTVRGAPEDAARDGAAGTPDGTVVHPIRPAPVFDRPGGRRIATLPSTQLGGPTWVPVVETSGDWRRVLLPSRPNRASGWVAGTGLRTAHTPYSVRVDVAKRRLTLLRSGRRAGRWTVAVGGAKTPTPAGRTFIMASVLPAKKTPSPLVLPLGTHSATLDTFGGGPGTVALHGWPDASVFGKAVTHGCVRVPADALKALSRVPLGSPVLITA